MEKRRCYVKFEPRLNPEIGSHCIWHYLVHTERDNSFFWLEEMCDSLDFQVFWHSLNKFSCRMEANTPRVCSNTHLASTQRQPVLLSAPTWWRAQIWLLQQGHTGCEILWLMHNHINSLHIILACVHIGSAQPEGQASGETTLPGYVLGTLSQAWAAWTACMSDHWLCFPKLWVPGWLDF